MSQSIYFYNILILVKSQNKILYNKGYPNPKHLSWSGPAWHVDFWLRDLVQRMGSGAVGWVDLDDRFNCICRPTNTNTLQFLKIIVGKRSFGFFLCHFYVVNLVEYFVIHKQLVWERSTIVFKDCKFLVHSNKHAILPHSVLSELDVMPFKLPVHVVLMVWFSNFLTFVFIGTLSS